MAESLGKGGLCFTGWGVMVWGFYSLMTQRRQRWELGAGMGRVAGLGHLEQWKLVPRLAWNSSVEFRRHIPKNSVSVQKQEIFVHEKRQQSLEKSASPSFLRTHLGFMGI